MKTFDLISPTGKRYTGKNLQKFVRKNRKLFKPEDSAERPDGVSKASAGLASLAPHRKDPAIGWWGWKWNPAGLPPKEESPFLTIKGFEIPFYVMERGKKYVHLDGPFENTPHGEFEMDVKWSAMQYPIEGKSIPCTSRLIHDKLWLYISSKDYESSSSSVNALKRSSSLASRRQTMPVNSSIL